MGSSPREEPRAVGGGVVEEAARLTFIVVTVGTAYLGEFSTLALPFGPVTRSTLFMAGTFTNVPDTSYYGNQCHSKLSTFGSFLL